MSRSSVSGRCRRLGHLLLMAVLVATVAGPTSTVTGAAASTPASGPAPRPGGAAASPCVDPDGQSGPTTITVWHSQGFEAEAMLDQFAASFEEANPAITVELVKLAGTDELLRRLRSDEPRPDVALTGADVLVNLSDSGAVIPASACISSDPTFDEGDLLPAPAATYRLDDTLWAVPTFVSTPVLYFDRQRFRAAGLDPDTPITTLPELRSAIDALMTRGGATDGLLVAPGEWFVRAWAADLDVMLAGDDNGRHAGGAASVSLTDLRLVTRLDQLSVMAANHQVSDVDGSNFGDLLRLIDPASPAGMTAHTSGSMKYVYDLMDTGFATTVELGVGPFPATTNGTTVGGDAAWLLAAEGAQADAAWQFIRYITATDQQAQVGTLGYVPARRSSLSDPALMAEWARRPGLHVPVEEIADLPGSLAVAGLAAGTDRHITTCLGRAVDDILAGLPVIQTLRDTERDIAYLLSSYRVLRGQLVAT